MIRRPPRSTLSSSSAASDVYKRQVMTTLDKFMRRRGLSTEEIMHIEYTPALQAKEGNKLPHDDWVASVRAPFNGDANFLITGSYDNCVRVWSGEECLAVGAGHSEAVKEVAFHPVPVDMPSDIKKAGKKRSPVSYTHLRAHETPEHLVCRLLLEKKKKKLLNITTWVN
eukprot:TRINITY_DN15044_c0_g1_i2.p1 TRINITY_DN15044_c0_g1~~TRINITY_DN15044_c0_g1_i2.p1  ORF type:complete len:169 (-),score=62.79 TRINITY_DN15044_c0_g1_i2:36-542(-)